MEMFTNKLKQMEKLFRKIGKRYKEVEPQRFEIDYFEFCFLVEACIPPRPIARAYFWQKVIDKYYYELTQNERDRLFEWVNRHTSMEEGIKNNNEDCLLFNARYDKNNQYLVHYKYNGVEDVKEAFLWKKDYYIAKNTLINNDYIVKIEKLFAQ